MSSKPRTLPNVLPYLLIILSSIALICSFIIMQEKIELLQNPNYRPSCSLNPIISCGSVMHSNQSHAFGFPNPVMGLIGFPVVVTLGVLLLSGAKFKRWIWVGLQLGLTFALLFVHWLFIQSVYEIHALCVYCITVWLMTIGLFWYTLLYNLRAGHIKAPARLKRLVTFAERHHADILVFWYLLIAFLILHQFWYYFKTTF